MVQNPVDRGRFHLIPSQSWGHYIPHAHIVALCVESRVMWENTLRRNINIGFDLPKPHEVDRVFSFPQYEYESNLMFHIDLWQTRQLEISLAGCTFVNKGKMETNHVRNGKENAQVLKILYTHTVSTPTGQAVRRFSREAEEVLSGLWI